MAQDAPAFLNSTEHDDAMREKQGIPKYIVVKNRVAGAAGADAPDGNSTAGRRRARSDAMREKQGIPNYIVVEKRVAGAVDVAAPDGNSAAGRRRAKSDQSKV